MVEKKGDRKMIGKKIKIDKSLLLVIDDRNVLSKDNYETIENFLFETEKYAKDIFVIDGFFGSVFYTNYFYNKSNFPLYKNLLYRFGSHYIFGIQKNYESLSFIIARILSRYSMIDNINIITFEGKRKIEDECFLPLHLIEKSNQTKKMLEEKTEVFSF
jgi:hypothetical protein